MAAIPTSRHDAIFNHNTANKFPVTIIGVGATGSRVFESLIELGVENITLFDDDVVEPHNLANQAFLHEDIGKEKVQACLDIYRRKTGQEPPESIQVFNERVDKDTPQGFIKGIIFLLTDTMASRQEIAEFHIRDNFDVLHVIETRMASSYGNVYSFNPHEYQGNYDNGDRVAYEHDNHLMMWKKTLIDDDAAEVSACGASISVGPTASIIANLAVWQYIIWNEDYAAKNSVVDIHCKPMAVQMLDWKETIKV